jgi:hypothetical protein
MITVSISENQTLHAMTNANKAFAIAHVIVKDYCRSVEINEHIDTDGEYLGSTGMFEQKRTKNRKFMCQCANTAVF